MLPDRDAGGLALARARNAEAQIVSVEVDDNMRFAQSRRASKRKLRAFRRRQAGAVDKHHEPVAVAHVPLGPLSGVSERCLCRPSYLARTPVGLGMSSAEPPAAIENAVLSWADSITEEGLLGTCGSAPPTWPR
jgi:hypothetical protein